MAVGIRRRQFIFAFGGASLTWSLAARAQQSGASHRIAWVHPSARLADLREDGGVRGYRAFLQELRRLGHVEGTNLIVERYSAEGRADRYEALARTAVESKPALILSSGTDMTHWLVAATKTVPIIAILTDPIATGLITNLAHPGGNLTGASVDAGIEIWGKRLDLLKQVVPAASRVGFLSTRTYWDDPGRSGAASRDAAQRLGLSLVGCLLDGSAQEADYRRVFAAMPQDRLDALVVSDQAEHAPYWKLIAELTQQAKLPGMGPYREYVDFGGLMAYTVDLADAFRHAAQEADEVLKGAKPGDLPFYQQTKFELVINLTTAKAFGLQISPAILSVADEVVE